MVKLAKLQNAIGAMVETECTQPRSATQPATRVHLNCEPRHSYWLKTDS